MKSAPCSAIITVGALVLPDVIRGMTDASMTRKPRDAADPQAVVDDGERVHAHAARADRVEDRRAEIAGGAPQIGIARRAPGPAAIPRARTARARGAAMMRRVKLEARDRDLQVLFGREVVQRDGRVRGRVGALDAHVAAARRLQVADRRRDRVERVQRRRRTCRATTAARATRCWPTFAPASLLRERAELRRRHRQRAGAQQRVLERHRGSAEPGARAPIQRARVAHLINRADLQMVVQVRADAGQVGDDVDAVLRAAARPGPTPESCRICGEPIAPAASSTSRRARKVCVPASAKRTTTPVARGAPSRASMASALDERAGAHGQVRPVAAPAAGTPWSRSSARRGADSSENTRCRNCRRD